MRDLEKTKMVKNKIHVLVLSDEDKERLTKIANKCIDVIDTSKNIEEKAFILKTLMEAFEEAHDCIIPFQNRKL